MKFMKVFWAALAAVVVGGILSSLLWVITIFSLAGAVGTTAVNVMPNSILRIDLADNITDAPSVNPLAGVDFQTMQTTRNLTLLNVLRAIEAAKSDTRIKGIYINFSGGGSLSVAALEEMRAAIADFKQSGKFVVAFNDTYSQMGYYLASVADKVYIQPEGSFSWVGAATTSLFFKEALDRLDISVEVFRPTVCKYKSAVEPYVLSKMSEANRRQMEALCRDVWDVVCDAVSESRGIDRGELNRLADRLAVTFPEDALKHKFVDGILYRDQMEEVFAELGVEKGLLGDYEMVSLGDYCTIVGADMSNLSAPKVAIVYAEGQIIDGEGIDDVVYGTTMAETLASVRKDESVKSVVLRVNSPGGSALASDVIWREVELLKAVKPVIVSMGAYAASGGYYISCPADAILADRLTLTGSIGVYGMMLDGEDMLRRKLGITTDVVKTNPSADFGANILGLNVRRSTPQERNMLLRSVDKVYHSFTTKVASGRNLPLNRVLEIAEGRVWSGTAAVGIGLVDGNGGLREAISLAADKAGIADNFRVEEVLDEMTPFAAFMQAFGAQARSLILGEELSQVCDEYAATQHVMLMEGVQTFCPYRIVF
ncbi:MAG: signal peptide peptidase SppA [Alistipes sp.]|nr:signal peptide peptidase SppA [Alistipes sp.]